MYIIGIDRADLSKRAFVYKIAIANMHGEILKAYPNASRDLLKKIINLPTLTEPCVWSDKEFKMIENLTDRDVKVLKDFHIERNGINNRSYEDITPFFIFNRTARQLKFKTAISEENMIRYDLPPMEVYYDVNGNADFFLSKLCYETLILARIQTYEELFN